MTRCWCKKFLYIFIAICSYLLYVEGACAVTEVSTVTNSDSEIKSRGRTVVMSSTRTPDPTPGWLSDEELAEIRHRLPLLYVEAVPVRLDGMGEVRMIVIVGEGKR